MTKVYIVYDHNDGEISRVFDNRESAEAWIKLGHEEGWLYDEDCSIYEKQVHSQ
jgi:antibiotic biosynthesis monooxygenase (ABM) superfamily enzyme